LRIDVVQDIQPPDTTIPTFQPRYEKFDDLFLIPKLCHDKNITKMFIWDDMLSMNGYESIY